MKYLKSISIYGLSNLINKLSAFILLPIFTHELSQEQFGLYDFYLTLGVLTFVFFESQIVSGFIRFFYEEEKRKNLRTFISSIFFYYLFSTALLWLIYSVSIDYFSARYSLVIPEYILIILLGIFPRQISEFVLSYFRLKEKSEYYLIFNLLQAICVVGISYYLVAIKGMTVEGALWGLSATHLLFLIPNLLILRQFLRFSISKHILRNLIKYSYPIIPAVIGFWIVSTISRVFISNDLNLEQLGIYGFVMKFAVLITFLTQTFRLNWEPLVMKMFTKKEKEIQSLIPTVLSGYFITLIAACLLVSLVSPFLIKILSPEAYWGSAKYVSLVLLIPIWQGSIYIFAFGNQIVSKTYYNSIGSIVGGTSSLILMYFTIQHFQLWAVLWAGLFGMVFNILIIYYTSQVNYKIAYNSKYLMMFVLFTCLIPTVIWYQTTAFPSQINFLIIHAALIVLFLITFISYKKQIKNFLLKMNLS